MDLPYWPALIGVAATLAALFLFLVILSGGDFPHLGLGIRCLVRILRDSGVADKVQLLISPPPPEPPKPSRPSGVPLRFLTLLQREGRLVDFLTEDIQAYDDAQVGAAVREIHRQCQQALREHLELEPVLTQEEGSAIEVPAGFDPSAIRLTGNLTGQPPFHGTLIHRGWRAKTIKLAAPTEGQDELILHPAEVELP
jgi:hypothetical protein